MTLEELTQIPYLIAEIKALQLELYELRNANFYKNNIISDMPRGGQGAEQPFTYVSNIAELEKELEFKIELMQRKRLEIEKFIETIEDIVERSIVRMRCINTMTWEEIGEEVNMSRTTAMRTFKKSINKLL